MKRSASCADEGTKIRLTGDFPALLTIGSIRPIRAPALAKAYHFRKLAQFDVLTTTQLLEKAMREVAKLPPSDQDAVVAIVLEELASEQKWAELFERSQNLLAKLAEEALAEHRAGKTKPL